jgi:hypothetical protein
VAKDPKAAKGAKLTKAKKKCCKDKPRCAQCPVVLMRLAAMGYAEQDAEKPRRYTVEKSIPKKAMLIARQR